MSETPRAYGAFVLEAMRETRQDITLKAAGSSMLPMIAEGDTLRVRLQSPPALSCGDIAVFCKGEQVVVHRILASRGTAPRRWFCEMGDNGSAWSWVPEDRVFGRVEEVSGPRGRLDVNRLARPWIDRSLGCIAWGSAVAREVAERVERRVRGARPLPPWAAVLRLRSISLLRRLTSWIVRNIIRRRHISQLG